MSLLVFPAATALAAAVLSFVLCRLVIALGPLDRPDGVRKHQAAPVPSAGGLGFGPATLVAWLGPMVLIVATRPFPMDALLGALLRDWAVFGGLCLAALGVGYADDRNLLSTKVKFGLLAGASFLAVSLDLRAGLFFVPWLGDVTLSDGGVGLWALDILGSALWLFVLMNAVNFMDGSNGLAIGTVAIASGGLLTCALVHSDVGFDLPLAAFIGAASGFLIWNVQGRIFAGDTGAYFAGAVFGAVSLWLVQREVMSVWTPAALALPILVDVFLTLAWRARRGRNLLSAHRDHAYQLLLHRNWSHAKVARLWWGLSAAVLVVSVVTCRTGSDAAFIAFISMLALGCAAWSVQRRRLSDRVQTAQ